MQELFGIVRRGIQFRRFFYVLGFPEDNRNLFSSILEAETYLLYFRWLTLDQINKMSYLDFQIYSDKIFQLKEAEEKAKAEAMKGAENQGMNMRFPRKLTREHPRGYIPE